MKVWIVISRPYNVLITGCAVFIGALLTGTITPVSKIVLAMLSAAFICGGGNVENDYFDVEIDRINKPKRPIPSGKIKRKSALFFYVILSSVGIIISIFITFKALILAVSVVILLFAYNAYLKRNSGIIGNIAVSFTVALSIVYGGIAVGKLEGVLFPAILAFLFNLGREIIKDIEDISGDKSSKSYSVPSRYSLKKSYIIAFIPLFLLIVVTPLPYLFHIYNLYYLIIVITSVDLLLLLSFLFFWKKFDSKNIHKLSNILKIGMLFGLLSLVIGII